MILVKINAENFHERRFMSSASSWLSSWPSYKTRPWAIGTRSANLFCSSNVEFGTKFSFETYFGFKFDGFRLKFRFCQRVQ